MKSSFLLTRPDHDLTTKYLYFWSEVVLKASREKNILTIDLASKEANKRNFLSAVKKYRPSFVYFNGHGSPNTVTGFNNEPLIAFADNEKILKDRVAYALSCQSAKRLGKSCVADGAKTYLGYDEDFIFVFDEEKEEDPLNDKVAENFIEPSNTLVLSILEGKTTGEAYQNSQEEFKQKIVRFSLSEATAEERELLPYLLWDEEHQVCLGSKQAGCEFISEEDFERVSKFKWLIISLGVGIILLAIFGLLILNFK